MNTLAIADKLIASGTPEPQARAQAQIHEEQARETKSVVKEEVAQATEGFVTRTELFNAISAFRNEMAEMRGEMAELHNEMVKLRADLDKMEARMEKNLADRETRMTRFTVGAMIGGMTVLTALFGIFVAPAIQALS